MGIRDWLPDGGSEASSPYDGFLSHATEFHASAIGAAAGLLGGLLLGTPMEPVGLGAMAFVGIVALGLKGHEKLGDSKAAGEVAREPWYALGFMVIVFTIIWAFL